MKGIVFDARPTAIELREAPEATGRNRNVFDRPATRVR
jgi:hypothetical protein